MPHTLAIPPGVEYLAFGEIPFLTSEAIVPLLPNEEFRRQFHRSAVQYNHEQALIDAEKRQIVTPRNPMSFELDGSSVGDYAAKRVVHVDQVRAFAALIGIRIASTAGAGVDRPKKESIVVQRAHALVVGLSELGYDPHAIPSWSYSEGGAKSAVRQWFKSHPLHYSDKTFDHAWDEARRRELICEADPEKS
jgi:hypothetical protein